MSGSTALVITYFGTASFLIQLDGVRILTDPGDLFTARLTEDKAAALRDIDIVVVTHVDPDHVNRLRAVPGIASIPVLAPLSAREMFPDLRIVTDAEYHLAGVTITTVQCTHGMRHWVAHQGYEIRGETRRILFLGDAFRIDEPVAPRPDVLMVTIGGLEANPRNALGIVRLLKPRLVIPMHWELFFRGDGKPRAFAARVEAEGPDSSCIVPPIGSPIEIPWRQQGQKN